MWSTLPWRMTGDTDMNNGEDVAELWPKSSRQVQQTNIISLRHLHLQQFVLTLIYDVAVTALDVKDTFSMVRWRLCMFRFFTFEFLNGLTMDTGSQHSLAPQAMPSRTEDRSFAMAPTHWTTMRRSWIGKSHRRTINISTQ